jgi:hypothetical protein
VVLAERRQWSKATPYAGSLLVHAVVAVAVSWVLFRPIVVKYENAIDVEVIDQKDLPKAAEPPTATLLAACRCEHRTQRDSAIRSWPGQAGRATDLQISGNWERLVSLEDHVIRG